ncbi:MAG: hypothetical protein U0136_08130 [Bdellovibrionota bacterium]
MTESSSREGMRCRQCGTDFSVSKFEEQLLERLSPVIDSVRLDLPLPSLCPDCRLQRRMIWRGELHLFHRKSALSGENFISFFPPDAPGRIYSRDDFWGETWDGRDYGREIDFSRPFFSQFHELLLDAPQLGLTGLNNQNCDFINNGLNNKNCYLTAAANFNEDCYYANYVNHSKSCVDNLFLLRCELCHECVSCVDCYQLSYSDQCVRCVESSFLFDCRRCQNCFGCVNLVDRRYCFFNEQLTKEDYERKLGELKLSSRTELNLIRAWFEKHRLRFPHRSTVSEGGEDVTGNFIYFSTNAHDCFDVNNVQDCRYCFWLHDARDCMDIYCWGLPAELCYECTGVGTNAYRNLFSYQSNGSRDIAYCVNTSFSTNCFGCVGITRKDYCILNKQYSRVDYERLVPRIVDLMRRHGEWGEFFPMQICSLPYNTTVAQDYFPLEKSDAAILGLRWHDQEKSEQAAASRVPDSIFDLEEGQLKQSFRSEVSGASFRIIAHELRFLKEHGFAPPAGTFLERHTQRLRRRNPRRLWKRVCAKCAGAIETSYAPFREEVVYCEKCFSETIY